MTSDMTIQSQRTSWMLSFSPAYPVPLSLLVEQNDDQLGVHLVSILTERQITPLKRHIHQVPVEGNMEEGDRGKRLVEAYITLSVAALKCFICPKNIYIISRSMTQFPKY